MSIRNSVDETSCLLCDGECTCRRNSKRGKSKKPSIVIDESESDENTPQLEYQVTDMWIETGTDDDASLSELDFSTSSDESVYEEPDQGQSDEDVMIEIVKEKILNGWTSNEEERSEEDHAHEDFFFTFDEEYPIKAEVFDEGIVSEPEITDEDTKFDMNKIKSPQKTPKVNENPNTTTTPSLPANPWVALAAIKNNAMNSTKTPIIKVENSKKTNNMLKKPLNMASVASAAAALMNSPAALRALSELRKRDPKNKNVEPVTPAKVSIINRNFYWKIF